MLTHGGFFLWYEAAAVPQSSPTVTDRVPSGNALQGAPCDERLNTGEGMEQDADNQTLACLKIPAHSGAFQSGCENSQGSAAGEPIARGLEVGNNTDTLTSGSTLASRFRVGGIRVFKPLSFPWELRNSEALRRSRREAETKKKKGIGRSYNFSLTR